MLRYVLLLLSILAMSTSVIWIKAGTTHPFIVAALRLLVACVLLTPVFLRDRARHRDAFRRDHLWRTLLPAVLLAGHFLSWTAGARMTGSAQASLIVNMVPVAMPFLLFYVTGERINRLEILGTAIAIAGVLVLTLRDAWSAGDPLGNIVCFGSMLLFALYIAFGRRNRDFPTVWLYVVPVYLTAGLVCLAASLPWIGSFDAGSGREWLMIIGLAAVPTVIGHTLLNNAVRHLRGQLVSLCTVGQFVFAGAMGWLFFREAPAPVFYGASILVVAGIAVVVLSAPSEPRARQDLHCGAHDAPTFHPMSRPTRALILSLLSVAALAALADDPKPLAIGSPMPHFELPGIDGKTYTPASFADAKVLCLIFTCNHCPTAQRYEERIKQLVTDYGPKGVAVVAINPNNADAVRLDELGWSDLSDSFEEMKIRAAHKDFNFPYLDDGPTQAVSRVFGPVATPHVFLFDAERKLRFQGRIDDAELPQYIKHHSTREALDALLAGRPVEMETTRVFGCSVKWLDKTEYNKVWAAKVAAEPVTVEKVDAAALAALRANKDSGKIRLINVWATWCGPCVIEFPDLVATNLQFRHRDFELITVAAEYPNMEAKVLKFLQGQHASMRNVMFGSTDKYALMEALDPEWSGALPHTLVVDEKGEVIFRKTGPLDFLELRRLLLPELEEITPWGGLDGN